MGSEEDDIPENWQDLPDSIIGIEQVLEEIKGKLHESCQLGFVGMGGIGKTTLVMALFNDIEYNYDFTCFIKDVKDIEGPVEKIEDAILENIHQRGRRTVEFKGRGLKGKKLLLVLDNVNSHRDLAVVRIITNKFDIHKGSRFIATSRNKELLASFGYEVHPVPFLSPESSKDLFLSCAPNGLNLPFQSYVDDIVEKCDGFPLTLQVVGKYLDTKSDESIWKLIVPALDKAEDVADLDEKLWVKLKISYDGLLKEEKDMFLDAATVFYKSQLSTATAAWNVTMEGREIMGWQHLLDLSLVWEIRNRGSIEIGMHEELLHLGRNISSTPREDGRRIWNDSEKALEVLSSDSYSVDDMKDVLALKVCSRQVYSQKTGNPAKLAPQNYVNVWGSPLRKMSELKYLWLEGFDIDPTHDRATLPSTIVFLHLSSMKFSDFPFNPSHHQFIAVLSLRNVDGFHTLPAAFGHLSSLQILRIEGNSTLESLPYAFGNLRKLKHLTLKRCPSLKMLPYSLGQLVSLETLEIGICRSLLGLPESIGHLVKLKDIRISGCRALLKLPLAFLQLQALERIELNGTSLLSLWHVDFEKLKSLKTLRLSWSERARFPHSLPECLREQITRANYTCPLTFTVVDGILRPDRRTPSDMQHFHPEIFGIDWVLVEAESILESTHSLGIAGMAGIGKTTLAMALFNKLAPAYKYTCFIKSIKDIRSSVRFALLESMHKFGRKLTLEKEIMIDLGFLRWEPLLLTLDDVTSEDDLQILPILRNIVHEQSRFIITSRDFALCQKHGVSQVIRVPFLEPYSSRQLLLALASPGLSDDDDVDDIVQKCEGLPLSLEVVGRYLRKESKKLHLVPKGTRQQVISALEYKIPMSYFDGRLWAKLRLSYYALDEVERDMFLDAATVFYKSDLSTAKAAWSVVTKGQQDMKWQRLVDLSLVWEIRDQEKTEIGMQAQFQSLVQRIALVRGANGRRVWNDSAKAVELLSVKNHSGDDVRTSLDLHEEVKEEFEESDETAAQ